jgi:hypothetical protein
LTGLDQHVALSVLLQDDLPVELPTDKFWRLRAFAAE